MRYRSRLIAAAAVTMTLAAGGTAAAAAGGNGGPATHSKITTGKSQSTLATGKSPGTGDTDLANRLGVSPDRLNSALHAAKSSLRDASRPTPESFYAALARNLGIPLSQVRQAFPARTPTSKSGNSEQAGHETLAAAVAQTLHVSTARVTAALRPLFAAGGADESSPAFAAAARSLGVSVEQLDSALIHAKMRLAAGH